MVNLRDLEVVGTDFDTFSISSWFWSSENPSDPSCHSGALAHRGRPFPVSLLATSLPLPESHVPQSLCFQLEVLHHS